VLAAVAGTVAPIAAAPAASSEALRDADSPVANCVNSNGKSSTRPNRIAKDCGALSARSTSASMNPTSTCGRYAAASSSLALGIAKRAEKVSSFALGIAKRAEKVSSDEGEVRSDSRVPTAIPAAPITPYNTMLAITKLGVRYMCECPHPSYHLDQHFEFHCWNGVPAVLSATTHHRHMARLKPRPLSTLLFKGDGRLEAGPRSAIGDKPRTPQHNTRRAADPH
jgi:hypothetical protein